jgi:hypothetical protein
MTPRHFYGFWSELELIEVGGRAAYAYDESNALMHRFCQAVGVPYSVNHNYWGRLTQPEPTTHLAR